MKTVFFDFDGTLTFKSKNIWVAVWQSLGYDTDKNSYFSQLLNSFFAKEISHQKWSDLTSEAFIERGLNFEIVQQLTKDFKLINGLKKMCEKLKENNFKLFVLSGNVKSVISSVLGENGKFFEDILANEFSFDSFGNFEKIIATKYDFEGKATFISDYIKKTNSKCSDVYFVGNGRNDEWVHETGCTTICVNPDRTDITNKEIWHYGIEKIESLIEILPIILKEKSQIKEEFSE